MPELLVAAKDIELDVVGTDKDDELRRFLEVAAGQQATGIVAFWYWQEDEGRMPTHAPEETYGKNWVKCKCVFIDVSDVAL